MTKEPPRFKTLKLTLRAAPSTQVDIAANARIVELVRHLARMAAERDYKAFLATGEIPDTYFRGEEN